MKGAECYSNYVQAFSYICEKSWLLAVLASPSQVGLSHLYSEPPLKMILGEMVCDIERFTFLVAFIFDRPNRLGHF